MSVDRSGQFELLCVLIETLFWVVVSVGGAMIYAIGYLIVAFFQGIGYLLDLLDGYDQ